MILEIISKLKYFINRKILLMKYGSSEGEIYIQNDFVYLTVQEDYKSRIAIGNITDIIYNMDNKGYYFRVKAVRKNEKQFFFDRKYDIRYRAKNLNVFIESIKSLNIQLTPDFGQYGALYEQQQEGIIQYCTLRNKYLLTIIKDTQNTFHLNHGNFDRNNHKIIDLNNLSIENEMRHYGQNMSSHKIYNVSFGVYILDKKITFDRGFCLATVDLSGCNNSPMVYGDDIFYSFDEEEIKTKIIELFEKYDK